MALTATESALLNSVMRLPLLVQTRVEKYGIMIAAKRITGENLDNLEYDLELIIKDLQAMQRSTKTIRPVLNQREKGKKKGFE